MKVKTTVAAVTSTNHVEPFWSKLKGLLLDAANEIYGLFKNHKWRQHNVCTVQNLQHPQQGRQDDWGQGGKVCIHWCQGLGQRRRNSPQYLQMVTVLFILPNIWTARIRTLLMRIVYSMMLVSLDSLTKARWRHGLSAICYAAQMSSLNRHEMRSTQMPVPFPVCLQPWSTKHLSQMKCGKVTGPSIILAEMLKAADKEGV